MREYEALRGHQLTAVQHVLDNPAAMLGLAMGCGKTAVALTAFRHLLDTFQVTNILVIAPLLVAEETWPEEVETWKHTSVLDYEVLTGSVERRENRARRLPELSIINTENVGWLVELWGDDWPYDMVCIDEISRFKNPAKRTKPTKRAIEKVVEATIAGLPKGTPPEDIEVAVAKAIKKIKRNLTRFGALASVRGHIDRFIGLTGTMAPNGMLDLWSQFYLLDQGERLHTSFHQFRTRYFDSDYMGFKYAPRPGAFEAIVDRISDITISMRTEDYVDMPQVVYNTIKVRLPSKIMTKYRNFEKTLLLEDHDIEAVNNGVLTGKLLQLCIAEGTEVLCERGWVPIQNVVSSDKVWDGVEYVSTKGVKYNGKSPVVVCYGVEMTEDHKVLTTAGWRPAKDVLCGKTTYRLDRAEVRLPDGLVPGGDCKKQSVHVAMPLRMRRASSSVEHFAKEQEPWEAEILRMQARRDAAGGMGHSRDDGHTTVGDMAGLAAQMPGPERQGLRELWGEWDRHAGRLVHLFQRLLGGRKGRVSRRPILGQERQRSRVQQVELSLGVHEGAAEKHASESQDKHQMGVDNGSGSRRKVRHKADNGVREDIQRVAGGASSGTARSEVKVYDLVDCGPRNRFVVRGADGCVIVHNCNGSVYDEEGNVTEIHSLKLDALDSVIEEAAGAPVLVAYSYQFDLDKLRKKYPKAEVVGEAKNLQKRWNNGEIPILLAHPASAGHGLNLQYGGCVMVWYGLNWSLELYQQLNKRLHRPGQTETVFIHHIVAEGTMDERVMAVLPEKEATQDALIEATLHREET